ncbi:hypothetical protein FOZ62_026448, partial [Perkinsus olseni]
MPFAKNGVGSWMMQLLESSQRTSEREHSPLGAVEESIARHAALACQTMRHHVSMGLKLVSEVYVEYSKLNEGKRESLVEAGETREESKDSVSLGIIMLNSALLKGLHVLDCLQGRCVQEYPELTHDLEDHLMSFDGSLTTIYEGHQSQKVVGDVEEMSERLLNGKLIRVEHVNAALNSQKEWYEREKQEMVKRVKQLEGNCEELRNALEVSQKSRPVTAETCAGSNRDPVGTSGEIIVYDSEDEGAGRDGNGGIKKDPKTVSLPEDEVTRLLSIIQRLSSSLTSTRSELGQLKRRGFAMTPGRGNVRSASGSSGGVGRGKDGGFTVSGRASSGEVKCQFLALSCSQSLDSGFLRILRVREDTLGSDMTTERESIRPQRKGSPSERMRRLSSLTRWGVICEQAGDAVRLYDGFVDVDDGKRCCFGPRGCTSHFSESNLFLVLMPIVEENTTAGAAGHSQISSPRTPPIHRNDINTGTATIRRVASREERAHNRRSGQSSGSVTSRCTGRFTIEDGGSVRFDSLPGGSVSIRRKETLDELDLVEPVPEFGCAWQSSSSCCELAAVSDDACGGLSPNDREQSRSVCADLPKAQLTVKVPKRIGRFDVVDATPRAAPPPSIATDMRESSVDSHQIVQ